MFILEALESTALAEYMRVSAWGYPIGLILHGIGMAILVGLAVIVCMRILGWMRSLPGTVLRPTLLLAVTGLVINFASGLALFTTEPVRYVTNAPFIVKIIAIVVAIVLSVKIYRHPAFRDFQNLPGEGTGAIGDNRLQVLAVSALIAWVVSLMAGRLIAYIV